MQPSLREHATLNFYQWEYRYRGYFLYDTPVDIEVPYLPFYRRYRIDSFLDDSRVPSLFKRIKDFFVPQQQEEQEEQELYNKEPTKLFSDEVPNLVGLLVSFPNGFEIQTLRNVEFLNMLSFSEQSISFEIVGTYGSIQIQFVCCEIDALRINSYLQAYFPNCRINNISISSFGFDVSRDIIIADFGLHEEFVRPIQTFNSFAIDPLTSTFALMDFLQEDEVVVFQCVFKGISSPLAKDILQSVGDGSGGSFFVDAPEMLACGKEKVSAPLFSVIVRIATQGINNKRSTYLAKEISQSINQYTRSSYNCLIPLSNEGYDYDFHLYNLHNRLSNRLGFVLNTNELNTLVHYPNKSIVSKNLGGNDIKTKHVPNEVMFQKYVFGINQHNGIVNEVTFNDEIRQKHTHIIGATGTGKSTLIANMVLEDMQQGNGCAIFDPHGDIIDDLLLRIPEYRKKDVIIIDPSDSDFPIGFNLFTASSEYEKIVLSSDLVASFKRHSTAWGDTIQAVLSNAINTFLNSNKECTLIELKRFLIEDNFRNDFLTSVDDPSLHYYWEHEYEMVKKSIAPLLTRIDTFLRPKTVRSMLAQTKGIDFAKCIDEKRILLIKLSQGLIGEENSFLLGSIFLSKLNQVAQGRQSISKSERLPYYVYLDEFQNFITPSIISILSGARKYGLGLILAHQELAQIDDSKVLNSILSNAYTRICFRLGDNDAKKLESGFSYFDAHDLQNLKTGESITRVGSVNNDFNFKTFMLPEIDIKEANIIKQYIIQNTRNSFAQSKEKVDNLLEELLPKSKQNGNTKKQSDFKKQEIEITNSNKDTSILNNQNENLLESKPTFVTEEIKQKLIIQEEESVEKREHIYLQHQIKKLGQDRGFIACIEKETSDGKRIDITLESETQKIAFEISVTNTPKYEVQNIVKCLKNGYYPIVLVSNNKKHLNEINRLAITEISKKDMESIFFIQPSEITDFLDTIPVKETKEDVVKGFRITTEFEKPTQMDAKNIREHITKLLFKKK